MVTDTGHILDVVVYHTVADTISDTPWVILRQNGEAVNDSLIQFLPD